MNINLNEYKEVKKTEYDKHKKEGDKEYAETLRFGFKYFIMKRELLFLGGCIGSRTMLTVLSTNQLLLPYIGIICLIISLSFFYIYVFGSQTADKQLEWLGDKKIWWNELRAIHGYLYLVFAILAFNKNEYAWVILGIDTVIGLISWISHTYFKINFD
jgi:hypothetical protein